MRRTKSAHFGVEASSTTGVAAQMSGLGDTCQQARADTYRSQIIPRLHSASQLPDRVIAGLLEY